MTNPIPLLGLIRTHAGTAAHAAALLSPGLESLDYQSLCQHIDATALLLNRLGFRPPDRLAVVLPNGAEAAAAFLAVSAVCTCAPLNPAYREEEYRLSLADLKVKALLAPAEGAAPARAAAAALGLPVIDLLADGRRAGLFHLASSLPVDETIQAPIFAGLDEVALVLQTSGTTSRPKTVPLTRRNLFHAADNILSAYALTASDRCLNMMPLFHIHGLMAALAGSLASGGSVICAPGFVAGEVIGWLKDLQPTWYTAVPTLHQATLEQVAHLPQAPARLSLRFIRSCSSSLPPRVAQGMEAAFGVPVLEAYGMTEATHQMATNPLPPRPHKFGSVGPQTGTNRIAILDEQGTALPAGTVGEICIRGENVMVGYENNPAANASSFTDGWLRTGDRGYLDEDGYLFIQGRLKELINRGGEKITPREIDEVLLRHPAVAQAVAFAVPHPTLGEEVGAAVVLRPGGAVSVQELRQFASASLADFKVPRLIVFLKEVPTGSTGKVQRIGLAERLKSELESATASLAGGGTAARSPLEAEVLAIWEGVLERKLGVEDDFLALGGESIQAARILLQVNERWGMNLQIADIFDLSTPACMAEAVRQAQG